MSRGVGPLDILPGIPTHQTDATKTRSWQVRGTHPTGMLFHITLNILNIKE